MSALTSTLAHTWPPFVLITGLLFIGHVAASEGLFDAIGDWCARLPGRDLWLFFVTMAAVAIVTALLNLDTAVVFMTPIAIRAGRSRQADEVAFLYGTILMVNAASLLLIGSNLTNLLIFASRPVGGATFAAHTSLAWLASVLVTALAVAWWRRRSLTKRRASAPASASTLSWGPGLLATIVAVVLMLTMSDPALAVLVVGLLAESYEWLARRRVRLGAIVRVANPTIILPLFALALAVGWLGRRFHVASHLVAHTNDVTTALTAGAAAILINNLPAASLFAGGPVAHPYALLVGLNIGPNIFMTGAMSTLLWFRVARAHGTRPTSRQFLRVGAPVGLIALLVASLLV